MPYETIKNVLPPIRGLKMDALLPYFFKVLVSNYLISIWRNGGQDYNVYLRYVLVFNDSLTNSNSRLCNVEKGRNTGRALLLPGFNACEKAGRKTPSDTQ